MRVAKGCGRCRHRHIRCVIPAGQSSCTPCARLGRTCHFDPPFQFKSVHHVYQKSHGAPARFDLEWGDEQVWVDVSRPVMFVLETDEAAVPSDGDDRAGAHVQGFEPHQTTRAADLPRVQTADETRRMIEDDTRSLQPLIPPVPLESDELQSHRESARSAVDPAPIDASALPLREASLLRLFTQKIAPWLDICDPKNHFSTEVPRRALEVPMVLKALLALSARHDAIMANDRDWEASEYHGQCLQLLIAALNQKEEMYDDNLLITVVVLRVYEELENNTDPKFHLLGSNRLLNLMSQSSSSGGLAEAVSWQFLRQAIYASVVQYQPMQLNMQNYERSSVFHRRDDAADANAMIFLCAYIIQMCGDASDRSIDRPTWHRLSESVEEWHRTRPMTWKPLRYQAANVAMDRPFPEHWMLSPPAVVGLQYYHTACIFLTLFDVPSQALTDYERARCRRVAEKTIAAHLVMVIGLCLSNESVENGYFMASHLVHRFGYCLRHPVEQQGSVRFLARVEKVLGWRTGWIVKELEHQWRELAALDSGDM